MTEPTIVHGAGIRDAEGPEIHAVPLEDRVSFRLIAFYDPGTDQTKLRVDAKRGSDQYNGCCWCNISVPQSGKKIEATDPLIEPRGVASTCAVVADRKTLVAILEGLTAKLK